MEKIVQKFKGLRLCFAEHNRSRGWRLGQRVLRVIDNGQLTVDNYPEGSKVKRWGKEMGWILQSLMLLQNDKYINYGLKIFILHCSTGSTGHLRKLFVFRGSYGIIIYENL